MKEKTLLRFGMILILFLVAGIYSVPTTHWAHLFGSENAFVKKINETKISLGLDLQGGTELDYKVDLTEALAQNSDDDPSNNIVINDVVESVRDALESRVNPLGVSETVVKRSSVMVDGIKEEHILVQLPPNENVEAIKRTAEQDNRLEFFAEDLAHEKAIRIRANVALGKLKENWDKEVEAESGRTNAGKVMLVEAQSKDQLKPKALADIIEETAIGVVIDQLFEDSNYSFENGQPKQTQSLFVARLQSIGSSPKVAARHILLSYEGATRAAEDVPYKTKEEAKAKAEEILLEIQEGGDFAELAKTYSTGPSGPEGGSLGEFGKGQMVPAFETAVFALTEPGLVQNLIETDFGFHIIEVTDIKESPVYTYEKLEWDITDINWEKTKLSGKQLDRAGVGADQIGNPQVNLRFDGEGQKIFSQITGVLADRKCGTQDQSQPCRLGIKVGENWVSQPTVQEKLVSQDIVITGTYTYESAKALADLLNLGAIDAPVELSGQTTVGAELGQDQLTKSLKAGAFGLLATMIFMILFYRLPGVIAALALCLYAGMFITALKIWPSALGGPIVLSLSGVAGIALSIGLAVDGNILIFERMKEEIKKGKSLIQAVESGFDRAWSAIYDSNMTTLLICLILVSLGSSIIKGFAFTLIVGTLLSMFTAIFVSRNLLRFVLLFPSLRHFSLFGVPAHKIGKSDSGAKIRQRKKTKK